MNEASERGHAIPAGDVAVPASSDGGPHEAEGTPPATSTAARPLLADALPGGWLVLFGIMATVGGVLVLALGAGGASRAWGLPSIVLGVLSVRCGWRLIDGPPAWLPFVQANALYVAAALLNRVGDDDPGPVRWRTWVVEGGAWGVARVVNLAVRGFQTARGVTPRRPDRP